MKSIRLLGLLSVRAFPWVRKVYLLNQHFEQRVADKVLIGQQHDLAGGAGDGEGTYQLFLGIAQLQNGQFGDEGHAFAAFYHAHKGLHAAQVIGKLAGTCRLHLAEAHQLVAEAMALVEQPKLFAV